jgi:protein-disulfide isomerase
MESLMRRTALLCLLLAALPLVAQTGANPPAKAAGQSAAPAASSTALPSEATVNSFMQHMFGYDPKMKWQVVRIDMSDAGLAEVYMNVTTSQGTQAIRLYVTPDGRYAFTGDLVPFGADPFATTRAQLAAATGPARGGPADSPLTIVEFGDLQCPSCKEAQPIIEKMLTDNPNAHFVFENFPLSQHDWAFKAASYSDCIARQNNAAFWKFSQSVFDAQADIKLADADEKLKALATAAGVNGDAIAACSTQPDTKARVEASMKLGQQVGVTGTPTVFINGRKYANIAAVPYDLLNTMVKFQASQGNK